MLEVAFILNTTPDYFANWLEKYTSSIWSKEPFPTEKGYHVLQRARPQGNYPNIDRIIINGFIPDENDPNRGTMYPDIDLISFEFTLLSSTRTKIDASCVETPSILGYFIGELLTEIKRLWPEMDENPPVIERYQAILNRRLQNYRISSQEIATTDVISFEYQHDNTTTDQIDFALVDMGDRWNDKFPCPLWRVHCRPEEYGYVIAGNLWIPENERKDGKVVSDDAVDFGYFELTPHVLVGRYTITADWARLFFELLNEYLQLYGLPPKQPIVQAADESEQVKVKHARRKWSDTENKILKLVEYRKEQISNGRAIPGRIKACNIVNIDPKTVRAHALELWENWENRDF